MKPSTRLRIATVPVVKVEKKYVFDGPRGAVTLRELFEGRRQLIVYDSGRASLAIITSCSTRLRTQAASTALA
jgi:predicted dithiol-disulfide oxidoreductase (DUF899 family)